MDARHITLGNTANMQVSSTTPLHRNGTVTSNLPSIFPARQVSHSSLLTHIFHVHAMSMLHLSVEHVKGKY